MTGENDLFTGTDDARSGDEEVLPNDQPPLAGADTIGLVAWAKDLTYDEVHAIGLGFAPMLTGLLLLPFAPRFAAAMIGLSTVLTSAAIIDSHKPSRPLRYIVREPHYFLVSQLSSVVLGVMYLGLVALLTQLVGVLVA